ncbi:ATP synthase small subunit 6, mitochondrial [Linum perenne]
MRRLFDPWPVFFKREWNRNWPFLVGFAVTGTIITKMSLGLTEEEAKNSKFVQRHKSLVRDYDCLRSNLCISLQFFLPLPFERVTMFIDHTVHNSYNTFLMSPYYMIRELCHC